MFSYVFNCIHSLVLVFTIIIIIHVNCKSYYIGTSGSVYIHMGNGQHCGFRGKHLKTLCLQCLLDFHYNTIIIVLFNLILTNIIHYKLLNLCQEQAMYIVIYKLGITINATL